MADNDSEDLPNIAITAISGIGTALVTGAAVPVAVVAGTMAAAPTAIQALQKYWAKRQQRRLEEFWENFVHIYQHLGFDAAALEIDATVDESGAQESIVEAFRRVSEAYNDVAVGPLALLTAEYVATDTRPDRFFRGFGSLLSDITREEYADFKRMLDEICAAGLSTPFCQAQEIVVEDVPQLWVYFDNDEQQGPLRLGQYAQLKTIFSLLKKNGLGFEGAGGYLNAVSGPHVIVLKMEIVRRMHKYCAKA